MGLIRMMIMKGMTMAMVTFDEREANSTMLYVISIIFRKISGALTLRPGKRSVFLFDNILKHQRKKRSHSS